MKSDQTSIKKRSRNQTCMNNRIFIDLGLIFASFLGPKSVKNRSENDVEKQCDSRSDWKSQSSAKESPGHSPAPRFWGHGEGVGEGVNPSLEVGGIVFVGRFGKWATLNQLAQGLAGFKVLLFDATLALDHLSPRGLVGFSFFGSARHPSKMLT